MGDERKDQNLPARPTSSLMGQLVRQRQGGEMAPAQQQGTGVAGQQGQSAPARPGAQPPPGQSGMAKPGGAGAAPAAQQRAGGGVPEAPSGPSRADIERIDAK